MARSEHPWVSACAAALGFTLAQGHAAALPSCPNAGWVIIEANASRDTRTLTVPPNRTIFVRKNQITTTGDLTEIKLSGDQYDTKIQMMFTPEAAKRLHDTTTDRSGMRIAFVADDEVLSAVTWTGSYGMDAQNGVQISLGGAALQPRPVVEAIEKCILRKGG